jgi:hypothetical protein
LINEVDRNFTYANAVHQLTRIGPAKIDGYATGVRGVFHGAMELYLARYLNVPPAHLPGEDGDRLDDLPADAQTIRAALLYALTGSVRSISPQG